MEIKNSYLEKFLRFAAGKFKADEELTEEDLNTINELNLNQYSAAGEDYHIDFSEVPSLPGLKKLSLKGFNISPEDMEHLNSYSGLTDVTFVACNFDDEEKRLNLGELKGLGILYCKGAQTLKYKAPERLRIVSPEVVDVSSIEGIENVSILDLHSSKVAGLNALNNSESLTRLNLDGAEYSEEDKKTVEDLKKTKPNIRVSQKEDYEPTM